MPKCRKKNQKLINQEVNPEANLDKQFATGLADGKYGTPLKLFVYNQITTDSSGKCSESAT